MIWKATDRPARRLIGAPVRKVRAQLLP